MKKLPIGIQTFRDLVKENYLYVDKTKDIYNLINGSSKYYFLSRPRRFGKSLLLSTLKEIFSGSRELFEEFWIYDKIEWSHHPIIHLDFLGKKYGSPKELAETLEFMIRQSADNYGIELKEKGYDKQFNELIRQLARKEKVVILVDEYDKPIITHVEDPHVAKKNRDILRTFYEVIKEAGEYLKFVLITGVSKFSKVSIFSGLNNLTDITLDNRFSSMLGYTQEELFSYFENWLDELSLTKPEVSRQELEKNIKRWYNGYSWDAHHFVYNPFSILNLFDKNRFSNYWFTSGTPTFLVKLIKNHNIDLKKLEHYRASESIFDSVEVEKINVVSLLFQTGYLTVESVEDSDDLERIYTLSYPNIEVEKSLLEHLLSEFSSQYTNEIGVLVFDLKKHLLADRLESFFELMKSLFAAIPYNIFPAQQEAYFHSIIYLIMTLVGITIHAEVQTHKGRIDAVIETETTIYIMEFKMGTAEKALQQIQNQQYYQPYLLKNKPITLVGVGIDKGERNISSYKVVKLDK